MLPPDTVTVVVNGSIVTGSAAARVAAGRVVAPLGPIVVRLTARAAYDAAAATITIDRGATHLTVPVAFVENDVPYVELAPLVRRIGGSAVFDATTKTLSISVATDGAIATPAPYDSAQPQVRPTMVFTPVAQRPAPRSTETGAPHPRRTAIPGAPSQPVATPSPEPTDRRR